MELKIYNPSEDGFAKAIEWNHEEIKAEVAEKMSEYTGLVYTEDQIKDAKADRAKLNKFLAALENKRKEIKKQCMQPYTDFEGQMKEITGIVSQAIKAIDEQVKGYEEQQKESKRSQIMELFLEAGLPEFVKPVQLWNEKWLNKSTTIASIKAELETAKKDILESLQMLSNLPEFGFEASEVYKSTLDVTKAVNEAQRMAQIQKMKAEQGARRKAAEEAAERARQEAAMAAAMNPPEDPEEIPGQVSFSTPEELDEITEEAQAPAKRQWVAFKAFMTFEDALELKAFFDSKGIEFMRA